MSFRVKPAEGGGYDIVDRFGNIVTEKPIEELNKARAAAAARTERANEGRTDHPEESPDEPEE